MARLQQFYREKVVPDLIKKFGYTSTMEAPRITKITLNMGVSEAVSDKKVMDHAVSDLTKIAGQKPVVTKSKKAIAGFKIRDGVPIGCMVTLRGVRMYEFLDRFVTIALPRVRDFFSSALSSLMPTRSALPVAALKIATFDWWIDRVLSITPPVMPFIGFGLTCFFTTLTPSTIRRSSSTRDSTVPFLPLSRPVSTMTWSPLRILFISIFPNQPLRALPAPATRSS